MAVHIPIRSLKNEKITHEGKTRVLCFDRLTSWQVVKIPCARRHVLFFGFYFIRFFSPFVLLVSTLRSFNRRDRFRIPESRYIGRYYIVFSFRFPITRGVSILYYIPPLKYNILYYIRWCMAYILLCSKIELIYKHALERFFKHFFFLFILR